MIHLLPIVLMLLACSNGQSPSPAPPESPVKHAYPPMSLPDFLETLFINHLPTVKRIENQALAKFCEANELAADDSLNQANYFRVQFLHDLFTSTGAYDCNTGGILKLPYFWHWTTPNPRYKIQYLAGESPQNLAEVKPPSGFQRYKSLADVDRTPRLYLNDMVTETPSYRHPDCGDFYTFGWCSEREMAFATLLNTMGLDSKVVVSGNHSWTESLVKMTDREGKQQWVLVKTDNTFDEVGWGLFDGKQDSWRAAQGNTKTDRWYNEKARSRAEQDDVFSIQVVPAASHRIEEMVIGFYGKQD